MARPVSTSEDFERIVALPVRHLSEEQAQRDIDLMTPLLTTPLGRAEGARLILWQGTAIREIAENDGAYIQLGVGHGKSLIFWLAPYVLDAKRPLYICPAALRDDMRAAFCTYARHWKTPNPPPTIMAYSDFFRKGSVDLFEKLRPDFVGLDEAHKSTNQDGTFAQRYARWVEMSDCKTVCGTGTGTRFSIRDFSHNITWGLQSNSPLPLDTKDGGALDTWADALDEKIKQKGKPVYSANKRPSVGVLVDLASRCGVPAPDYFLTEQGRARWAFQVRMRSTAGIIISNDDSCKQPLSISLVYAPEDEAINAAFDVFRESEQGPDGEQYSDAIVMYTKERQLGCGVVQTWDPEPPEEWRAAYRARTAYCNHIIGHTRARYHGELRKGNHNAVHPCDTPDAVEAHPVHGKHPAIIEWQRIRSTFEPKTRPTWVSASVIHSAAKYARDNNALIWYEFEEVGRAIAAAVGCEMYGPGGTNTRGAHIRNDAGKRSVALSIDANLEGRNLQDRWCDNYIIGAPQSARELEQLLGRTHRFGQPKPVHATLLVTSGLSIEAWRSALREANFVRETQAQEQKILRATITEEQPPSSAVRWRVVQKPKGAQAPSMSKLRKAV